MLPRPKMIAARKALGRVCLVALLDVTGGVVAGQSASAAQTAPGAQTLEQLKADGARRSSYHKRESERPTPPVLAPDLKTFRADIEPILLQACSKCHGPDQQKGDLRLDTLDADLFRGKDVDWWLEVLNVLTNGEMPPEDDAGLAEEDRRGG